MQSPCKSALGSSSCPWCQDSSCAVGPAKGIFEILSWRASAQGKGRLLQLFCTCFMAGMLEEMLCDQAGSSLGAVNCSLLYIEYCCKPWGACSRLLQYPSRALLTPKLLNSLFRAESHWLMQCEITAFLV